jgi:hypothetical protein
MSCSHVLTMFPCSSDVPLISHNVHMEFSSCSLVIPKFPFSSHSHYMEFHNHSLRQLPSNQWPSTCPFHLSMKEGCLFVLFALMRFTELVCFRSWSWSLWKALEEQGCIGLVSCIWTLPCRSSWILKWMIPSLKIKFNRS